MSIDTTAGTVGWDRARILAGFADGTGVPATFGPDRPTEAARIAAYVYGITPSPADIAEHAFGGNRRVTAYVNGRAYLMAAYYDTGRGHALASLADLSPLGGVQ